MVTRACIHPLEVHRDLGVEAFDKVDVVEIFGI